MAKYLCIWVRAYWFSVTSFSKWLPGGHIRFFGFWMACFRQRKSSLLWNFSFKFHVHVLCGCRQKPNDCQLCCFQKELPCDFEQCHPLLSGGGILVDHWSTISSCHWRVLCILVRLQAWAWYDNTCQIQPVQRDRMPSGPTKYMSVFKYNHLK